MGSGPRFKAWKSGGFGLGFYATDFPFKLSLNVTLFFWTVCIGLGKAYDE